ncbi:MAG: hypothetical protein AB7O56_12100 [Bauldia sp.]
MTTRTNGWITARSQIAFVVGLLIAVGIIFWLEVIRFQTGDDPAGDAWLQAEAVPARGPVNAATVAALRSALAGPAAAGEDPTTLLLAASACPAAAAECAPLHDALAAAPSEPSPATDAVGLALRIVALAALLREPSPSPALNVVWRMTAAQGAAQSVASLPDQIGLRQFAGHAATLTGRMFYEAARYAGFRDVFDAADGLSRRGLSASAGIALGLGLLTVTFPDNATARQLFYRTYAEWPFPIEDTPVELIALWWSQFGDGQEASLLERVGDGLPSPLAAAIVLLAAGVAEAARPLLADP